MQIVLVRKKDYTRALTKHVPQILKKLKKRGSQSMVITEELERGTIRALRETLRGS